MRFLWRMRLPNGSWAIAGVDFQVVQVIKGIADLLGVSRYVFENLSHVSISCRRVLFSLGLHLLYIGMESPCCIYRTHTTVLIPLKRVRRTGSGNLITKIPGKSQIVFLRSQLSCIQ